MLQRLAPSHLWRPSLLPADRVTHLRRLLLLFVGLCVSLSSTSAQAQQTNWAEKMFKTTEHDFRAVGRGANCEYHFEFTNLYQDDVHIAGVRSSCGCTTPTVSKDLLKSRETGAVIAKFNTSSFIGQKSATITVVIDRPYYAEVRLKVEGYIRTDITFDPPEVAFGELKSGEESEQDITVTHTGNSNWQITDVRSHCEHLQVKLGAPQKSPGTVRYRMRVKVLETMPEGDVREQLTLISNDTRFPTTEMSVNGRIRPSLSVSPAAVNLGTSKPGAVVEKRLVIRGEEPFSITEVVCADQRFEFDTPPGEKKLHFVTMRFKAGDDADQVGQEIRINTDLKGGRSVKCVATGAIEG
ncbi:DUF1573 domain-containing protein [Roseiconus lacunae]|uniref:DUF1573 domain-containing protein n=1 Tax=Roseiconus lacunae TaxID=2605694 RepID=UPI001E434181|nr:DUF1573 domain-containing protein [Roseiconus lacunae]